MNKDTENLVPYMPKQFRSLHEGILSEISRPNALKSVPAPPPSPDVSVYVTRIQRASRVLAAHSARIRELEDMVYDLKRQQALTEAQLKDSDQRRVEIEQELAAEKSRTIRAEALALAADKRAKEREEAVSFANSKFETLTLAIEDAFKDIADAPTPLKHAA